MRPQLPTAGTTVKRFGEVQIEPCIRTQVPLFTSHVYVGGATCLQARSLTLPSAAQPPSASPLSSKTTRPCALLFLFFFFLHLSDTLTTRRLSKEAWLYADADWLSSSVSQRVARGQFFLIRGCTFAGVDAPCIYYSHAK